MIGYLVLAIGIAAVVGAGIWIAREISATARFIKFLIRRHR